MRSKVSVVKCDSYDPSLVREETRRAIDLIGGISNFIKPNSRVLVKPNCLMAKEPESGVDTHPEVLRAVIRLLKEINCQVLVGDSPSAWAKQIDNVDQVYEMSGIKKICQEEAVELVKFEKRRMRQKFPLTTWLDACDYLVNIPKFKTHQLTLLSGAIKNLYGLIPGTFKAELHKNHFDINDFSGIVVDVFEQARPALTIVDGIVAMEGDGPGTSGKLRNLGLLLAGADCVALDAVMATIMGINPLSVPTTMEAKKRNLGIADIDSIEVLGAKLEDVAGKPFLLPQSSGMKKIPAPLVSLFKRLVTLRPVVIHDLCARCNACIDACPTKVISLNKGRIILDYSGCISCFCCQEVCPFSAIKVKKSILARMIGL